MLQIKALSCDKVTRLEVIDNNGRAYVNRGVDKIEFSYQDDGRTLKLFTNGSGSAPSWQGLSDDERKNLWKDYDLSVYEYGVAIEQALKKKNTVTSCNNV